MKRIACLLLVSIAAVAYGGDAPIRWKNAPALTLTDNETWIETTATTSTADLLAFTGGTNDLTWTGTSSSYQPNVKMAPAAVRFERGMALCPHCEHEYDSKAGGHTIIMSGTQGDFETCIDNVITLLSSRQLGRWLPDEDEDQD